MADVQIALSKQYFVPCEKLAGKVILHTSHADVINSASLCFIRKRSLKGVTEDQKNKTIQQVEYPDRSFRKNYVLTNKLQICAGEHVFPFSILLGDNLGGTTVIKGNFGNFNIRLANEYSIEAVFHLENQQESSTHSVIIFNPYEYTTALDTMLKLDSWLCFFKTKYLLRIATDKTLYNPGDAVDIVCFPISVLDADSIARADATLYEVIVLKASEAGNAKTVKQCIISREIERSNGTKEKSNYFRLKVMLPAMLSATYEDQDIMVKIAILVKLTFKNRKTYKIKKYIDVGRPSLLVPKIAKSSLFSGKVYGTVALI
ncbi:hypothetical protein ENBRE01_0786 [Enteropsectra breve]|nr:hypothetical protein ENBRE01_0786 [Enteropsectra breve]